MAFAVSVRTLYRNLISKSRLPLHTHRQIQKYTSQLSPPIYTPSHLKCNHREQSQLLKSGNLYNDRN